MSRSTSIGNDLFQTPRAGLPWAFRVIVMNRGPEGAILRLFVLKNLFAVDADVGWGLEAQPYPLTADADHLNQHVRTNTNRLLPFPGQYKHPCHGGCPPGQSCCGAGSSLDGEREIAKGLELSCLRLYCVDILPPGGILRGFRPRAGVFLGSEP